jgi:hypothetical protein
MLHRKDYILRLIEQMGRALVQMLDRILMRTPDQLDDVEDELSGMAHRAGLDLALARRLTPESLHVMIAPAGTADPGRCWLLGELLYLHGLQAERRHERGSARQSYERSLLLYRMVEPGWLPVAELPPPQQRVRELKERLGGLDPEASEA